MVAIGRAIRRLMPIGSPVTSHHPYSPSSSRRSAASILAISLRWRSRVRSSIPQSVSLEARSLRSGSRIGPSCRDYSTPGPWLYGPVPVVPGAPSGPSPDAVRFHIEARPGGSIPGLLP